MATLDTPNSVQTIGELIDLLGGPAKATEVFAGATPQMVTNWRARGRIPHRRFFEDRRALAARGIDAPATLWGFDSTEARA